MPIMKYRSRTLHALSALVPEIVYVMCGARGETSSRLMRALPQVKFIGFEPDSEEYERLSANAKPGFHYSNAGVGGRDEQRTLYVTRNLGCASLLQPNYALTSRLQGCGPELEVVEQRRIDVVSLNSFLPQFGVNGIDFLDLDTQGSELEILRGAEHFLSAGTVVVKCEVEFSSLYVDQALFGDVHNYLRSFGFELFDLSRSRYRRTNFPPHALTRGQLLWGDSLFLRDYMFLANRGDKPALFKLCLLAAHLQFHDYAMEILAFLLESGAVELSATESEAVRKTREQYTADLRRGARWLDLLYGMEALGLKRPVKLLGRLATQLGERLHKDRTMSEYNWVD